MDDMWHAQLALCPSKAILVALEGSLANVKSQNHSQNIWSFFVGGECNIQPHFTIPASSQASLLLEPPPFNDYW